MVLNGSIIVLAYMFDARLVEVRVKVLAKNSRRKCAGNRKK